jgi:hypothetical protein
MNEFSRFLQGRFSVIAIFALSSVVGLFWVVGGGVVQYASIYYGQSQVLGESASSQFQCIPLTQINQFFKAAKKTVTLYAPDSSESFPLSVVSKCFIASGCNEPSFSCEGGQVNIVQSCVQEYFKKNPLGAETTRVVTGAGASVQIKTHDWSVNYENLAAQLDDAIFKEISYCQLMGAGEPSRQNIGSIQLVVADEQPSIVDATFAEKFLEIDASKEKVYLWQKGVYQTFSLTMGARTPAEAVYSKKDIDLAKLIGSGDLEYINKRIDENGFVVVHR